MIIRTDILIMAVLHAETMRDGAELDEAKAFIQMAGVNVGRNDRIKLEDAEAVRRALPETVRHQLFTDVQPAQRPTLFGCKIYSPRT